MIEMTHSVPESNESDLNDELKEGDVKKIQKQ